MNKPIKPKQPDIQTVRHVVWYIYTDYKSYRAVEWNGSEPDFVIAPDSDWKLATSLIPAEVIIKTINDITKQYGGSTYKDIRINFLELDDYNNTLEFSFHVKRGQSEIDAELAAYNEALKTYEVQLRDWKISQFIEITEDSLIKRAKILQLEAELQSLRSELDKL